MTNYRSLKYQIRLCLLLDQKLVTRIDWQSFKQQNIDYEETELTNCIPKHKSMFHDSNVW